MKIVLLAEGRTEEAFLPHLRRFLVERAKQQPKILPRTFDGPIPKEDNLKRLVTHHLASVDAVVALTDVYTGKREFVDAADARAKMTSWAGIDDRFHAHAAQHEFEAWLLPYWETILRRAGQPGQAFANPESVNHTSPPSRRLKDLYRRGKQRDYNKVVEGSRILDGQDLTVSARVCPEFKAFLNTFLTLCNAAPIP